METATREDRPGASPQMLLSEKEFRRLREFIEEQCGIHLAEQKKSLLEGRIRKRLRVLGIAGFEAYSSYLFSPEGMAKELEHMIDAVTTNKTDFFREPWHFEYLTKTVLPAWVREGRRNVRVWSAGCSTGDEPYTLAIYLNEFAGQNPGFSYSILATDISHEVLAKASEGVYDESKVEPMPYALRKKYLLRSKDPARKLVMMGPELKSRIEFRRLNLMDGDFRIDKPPDVIFCRNVIIYFTKETQERLIQKFCRLLLPGGYLFLGHSETITNMNVPLVYAAATVYRKA